MLRKSIPGVETGTVHVFQGAEKKYILFSCVIDTAENDSGLCNFIGGKCNLLNVAFSRQKSSSYLWETCLQHKVRTII